VNVYVDAPEGARWATAVRQTLANVGSGPNSFILPLTSKPTRLAGNDAAKIVLIREGTSSLVEGRGVILETWENGQVLGEPIAPADPNLAAMVMRRIRGFAQNTYLRTLEVRAADMGAEIDLIPCKLQCDSPIACGEESCACVEEGTPEQLLSDGNEIRMRHGDGFGIRLRNTGTRDVYVSVLDLMPDGTIDIIWPRPNTPVADTALAKDSTYRIPDPEEGRQLHVFRACPPYGTDVLKVLATTEEVDFSTLTGTSRGGEEPAGPLDRLFEDSLMGARGVRPTFSSGSVSTSAVTLTIEPPPGN
jgi:hypothetical protein